jgi:hypothetical protein
VATDSSLVAEVRLSSARYTRPLYLRGIAI